MEIFSFADKFTAVCLGPNVVGEKIANIQKHVGNIELIVDFHFLNTLYGKH